MVALNLGRECIQDRRSIAMPISNWIFFGFCVILISVKNLIELLILICISTFSLFAYSSNPYSCQDLIFLNTSELVIPIERIDSALKFGLTNNPHGLIRIEDSQQNYYILQGKFRGQDPRVLDLYNKYLFDLIPKYFREILNLDPKFIDTINFTSKKFSDQSTLILVTENDSNNKEVIKGGVVYYFSINGYQGLPLFEEIGKNQQPKLPTADDTFVEVGRVLMIRENYVTNRLKKRKTFEKIHAIGKKLLFHERLLQPGLKVISFTTAGHIRFYQSQIKVEFKNNIEINVENLSDGIQRFVSEIQLDTLPDLNKIP